MKQKSPISFTLFRTFIVLLAGLPLAILILALFGTGPAGDFLEQPLALIKNWFYSQTGWEIP